MAMVPMARQTYTGSSVQMQQGPTCCMPTVVCMLRVLSHGGKFCQRLLAVGSDDSGVWYMREDPLRCWQAVACGAEG